MATDRAPDGFGAWLRDARQRRGVSLREIANATKISMAALEALERDDISRLPGGIFSRAFVRSYAIQVGLDPEQTIQEFIAQFPNDSVTQGHPTSDRIEENDTLESDRRTAGAFLWMIVISVPLAGALLYFATSGRRVQSAPQTAPPPPPTSEPAAKPALEAATAAADPAAPESATPVPAGPAASPAPASPAATTPAPAPAASSTPSPAASTPAAATLAASTADADDHLTVAITAKRPCWVSATVDGQKAIERLLAAGEQKTVEVRRDMVLTAGDATAIALTFNGADARPLGKAGEVVTARFNRNNFKEYLQVR